MATTGFDGTGAAGLVLAFGSSESLASLYGIAIALANSALDQFVLGPVAARPTGDDRTSVVFGFDADTGEVLGPKRIETTALAICASADCTFVAV